VTLLGNGALNCIASSLLTCNPNVLENGGLRADFRSLIWDGGGDKKNSILHRRSVGFTAVKPVM